MKVVILCGGVSPEREVSLNSGAAVAKAMADFGYEAELCDITSISEFVKNWPGYKLVAGRTVRKYTSEAEVIKAATEAGYTDIYKTTLLGVGDLEKRLGRKKFSEVLGKYVVKPVGAPQLVPESDPRKPYSDAAGDFKE